MPEQIDDDAMRMPTGVDHSVAIAKVHLGEDDKAFRASRASRRKAAKAEREMPDMPEGPCCGRCRHWASFGADDGFGVCREALTVVKRWGIVEKGTCMEREKAKDLFHLEMEPMRTRAFFAGCRLYAVADQAVTS
ncbi:MAG: hypothetical protein ACR2OO_15845 [Thermomicrobiales bacterium]